MIGLRVNKMATSRIVKLPLKNAAKRYFSSKNYSDITDDALNIVDFFYTYGFRYPWFVENLKGVVDSRSAPMDFMASHPIAAVAFTLLMGAAAVATAVNSYRQQSKAAQEPVKVYQNTYHKIMDNFQEKEGESNLDTNKLSDELNKMLLEDKNLKSTYQEIKVTSDGQIELRLKEKDQTQTTALEEQKSSWQKIKSKISSWVYSSWVTLCIASFMYWILWISTGVVTGSFAPFGVEGMGVAGVTLPFAVGLIYPFIKIRNWWKNHYGQKIEKRGKGTEGTGEELLKVERDPRLVLRAAADTSKLLRKFIFKKEKERLTDKLKNQPSAAETGTIVEHSTIQTSAAENNSIVGAKAILTLGQGKKKKAATTFLATAVGSYIMSQYIAWLLAIGLCGDPH